MKILDYIITGLAGSTALTGLHQALKDQKDTPRVDLLGKQALEKMLGDKKKDYSDTQLYNATMAGDIITNGAFYGIIAKAKNPIFTGLIVGIFYGTGTMLLPGVFGLNKQYVQSTDRTKAMTIGYYAFGGLVAGIIAKILRDVN